MNRYRQTDGKLMLITIKIELQLTDTLFELTNQKKKSRESGNDKFVIRKSEVNFSQKQRPFSF